MPLFSFAHSTFSRLNDLPNFPTHEVTLFVFFWFSFHSLWALHPGNRKLFCKQEECGVGGCLFHRNRKFVSFHHKRWKKSQNMSFMPREFYLAMYVCLEPLKWSTMRCVAYIWRSLSVARQVPLEPDVVAEADRVLSSEGSDDAIRLLGLRKVCGAIVGIRRLECSRKTDYVPCPRVLCEHKEVRLASAGSLYTGNALNKWEQKNFSFNLSEGTDIKDQNYPREL